MITPTEKNIENNWYEKDFSEFDKHVNKLIGETPDIDNPNDVNLSRGNTIVKKWNQEYIRKFWNRILDRVNEKFIYENINYRNSFTYRIEGEVYKPGTYPINSNKITVGEALALAGGLTELGSESALTIQQEFTSIDESGNTVTDSETVNNATLDFEIGINSVIIAAPLENVVRIQGNVYNPGLITFKSGVRLPEYIQLAGGYKPDTLAGKVYIKRANGNIEKTRRLYFVGKKIYAGDTIIVPLDPNPTKFDTATFTADILSVLANLVAIVAIADNNN